MKQYKLSSFQYYKEVIKGNGKTQHMNIKLYSSDTELIDLSQAVITASSVPVSGNLESLLDPNNTVPVVFRDNEIVMINVDAKKVVNLHHITVKHLTSGSLADNNIKLSIDKEDWFTVYDMRESGLFDESKPLSIKTNHWFDIDPQSGMILDVEDISFFDPKLMIWDNDLKVQNFIKSLLSKSQYYRMHTDSTNNLVHLVNDEELYPERYMDNMMVNWIQLGSVSGVEQIKIKIGSLGEVNAKFPGNNGSFSLDGGKPYLGVYNAKSNTFLIVSGGAGGASSEISLYQPNSGFKTFDLAHYDGELKKFVVPELLSRTPKMVDVILEVQGDWLKGTNSGKVRLVGMTDSAGAQLKLGECYVADPKNPKMITAMEPSEGLVQPILQTFEENGELIGILMEGPSYYTGDGAGLTAFGKGLSQNDGVLEVETVDDINLSNPSPNKIPSELAVSKIKGIIVGTIADLVKTNLKVGDIVEVLGYYSAGDGAGHKRKISREDDGSGVQVANGLWANVITNGEVNILWFGAKCDSLSDDTLSIKKAVNCLFNIGNNRIVRRLLIIPANTVVTEKIIFSEGQFKILGGTVNISKIKFKGANAGFYIGDEKTLHEIEIDNVWFFGDDSNTEILKFKNCWNIYLERVHVSNHAENSFGITFENCGIINMNRFTLEGGADVNKLPANRNGIRIIKNDSIVNFENSNVWNLDKFIEINSKNLKLNIKNNWIECIREFLVFNSEADMRYTNVVIDSNYINIHNHSNIILNDFNFIEFKNLDNTDMFGTTVYIANNVLYFWDISGLRNKSLVNVNKVVTGSDFNITYQFNILSGKTLKALNSYLLFTNNSQVFANNFFIKNPIIMNRQDSEYICDIKNRIFGDALLKNNKQGYYDGVYLKSTENINDGNIFYDNGKFYCGYNGTIKTLPEKADISISQTATGENAEIINSIVSALKQANILKLNVLDLSTTYHMEKMKQEGVYNDYISYMDEKTLYDKQQRKLSEQRQLAYEEALKENPNLTYEEFMSVQPMTLNFVEEPQPSQALKDFMEKYL